jgi:RimJ/RimL family protein N-acetyltransferase
MRTLNVRLRREIYAEDAWRIIDWLQDEEITRHLNEHQNVCSSIRQVMQRVNMPVLTHLFNQGGSFFIVTTHDDDPVGFLRLVPRDTEAEIVIVIGDKEKWGLGLGTGAILQGLKHCFFEWRVEKIVAKIKHGNIRSINVFKKAGFRLERELSKEKQYYITINDFLKLAG